MRALFGLPAGRANFNPTRGFTDDEEVTAGLRVAIDDGAGTDTYADLATTYAGIDRTVSVEELTIEEWDTVLRTNLDALFYMTHAALPALTRDGGWI